MFCTETTAPCAITPPRESGDMLDAVVAGIRMTDLADALFEQAPRLRDVCQRLTWMLTPELYYPYTRNSIVAHCLSEAIPVAATCAGERAVVMFVSSVLANITRLLEIEVATDARRWDPVRDAALPVWMAEYGAPTVAPLMGDAFELYSPRRFAASVAYRILEPSDMRYVEAFHACDEEIPADLAA